MVGAFKLFVSTGAVESKAHFFNTPHVLGILVAALFEALRL